MFVGAFGLPISHGPHAISMRGERAGGLFYFIQTCGGISLEFQISDFDHDFDPRPSSTPSASDFQSPKI